MDSGDDILDDETVVSEADVFRQNFRPGTAERLEVGESELVDFARRGAFGDQ